MIPWLGVVLEDYLEVNVLVRKLDRFETGQEISAKPKLKGLSLANKLLTHLSAANSLYPPVVAFQPPLLIGITKLDVIRDEKRWQ